jgi:hypothetical protein
MSEETSTPNPAGRRRNAPEESGGGGKMLPIILGLAVLGLGYALFKSKSGVGNEEAKYTNEIASLKVTNQELVLKLAKETNSALADKSKLEALLDRRTAEVAAYSNRLVQTRQQLEREEAALLAARNEISTKSTTLGAIEVHRDELQRQAVVIPGLERELVVQKKEANRLQLDNAALAERLGREELQRADLERKLQDPLFLRRQATRVEQAAELRQRAAANQPIKMTDKRLLLDLQADGSVRPAIATSAPMPTNSSPKN